MPEMEYVGGPRRFTVRPTFAALFDHIRNCNDREVRRAYLSYLTHAYTPREVYECNEWITGINHQVPDGHVRFAMESFEIEPYYPVRQAATNMLVDSDVLWKLDEDYEDDADLTQPDVARRVYVPGKYVLENPNIRKRTEFRNEELVEVELEYTYEREVTGYSDPEIWVYNAIFRKQKYTQELRIFEYPLEEGPESRRATVSTPELAIWPYIGVQWEGGSSILSPVMSTIARYELCLQNIAHENDRHSRRKAVYVGTYRLDKHPMLSSADEEHEHLPENSKKEYPDTHPEGLQPMFDELKVLESEIRQTIGLIKVYPLHNASGVSREIEIRPQLSQALALRQRVKRMMLMVDKDAHIHFGPLEKMPPQELDMYIGLLEKAWLEGTINVHEYAATKRMLLGFPEVALLTDSHGGSLPNAEITMKLLQPKQQTAAAGGGNGNR